MRVLSFTLSPEAVGKLHDVLACLGKFSEEVSIEAKKDTLRLTALNSTKSAYASCLLSGDKFFTKYQFTPAAAGPGRPQEKFVCKLYNKALLSVVRGRTSDPNKEKETALERCEVVVEDGTEKVESRFIIKLFSKHGMLKVYRLTFESVAAVHALFNEELAPNKWVIWSRTLREFVDHFGPKTEQLDIFSDTENEKAIFTSYTEKVMVGKDVLKAPLRTSITIEMDNFVEFSVEDQLHIVVNVKDFKAIVVHAGLAETKISAAYSEPARPLRLSYGDDQMNNEFILMTAGEGRSVSAAPAPAARSRNASARPAERQAIETTASRQNSSASAMAPPVRSATAANSRAAPAASPKPPDLPRQSSLESNPLFFPIEGDDRQWDPEGDDESDQEILGWDPNANDEQLLFGTAFQNTRRDCSESEGRGAGSTQQLPPTQRLSGVKMHGLFEEDSTSN